MTRQLACWNALVFGFALLFGLGGPAWSQDQTKERERVEAQERIQEKQRDQERAQERKRIESQTQEQKKQQIQNQQKKMKKRSQSHSPGRSGGKGRR